MPVNLYGPGDNFDPASSHVIPALILENDRSAGRGLSRSRAVGRRLGDARVPLRLKLTASEAIWLATSRYDGREPVNIGSGVEIGPRPGARGRGSYGVPRRNHLGRQQAERAAAAASGCVPRGEVVRLPRTNAPTGRESPERWSGTAGGKTRWLRGSMSATVVDGQRICRAHATADCSEERIEGEQVSAAVIQKGIAGVSQLQPIHP